MKKHVLLYMNTFSYIYVWLCVQNRKLLFKDFFLSPCIFFLCPLFLSLSCLPHSLFCLPSLSVSLSFLILSLYTHACVLGGSSVICDVTSSLIVSEMLFTDTSVLCCMLCWSPSLCQKVFPAYMSLDNEFKTFIFH